MAGRQPLAATGRHPGRRTRRCWNDDRRCFLIGYLGPIGLVLLARGVRVLARAPRRHDRVCPYGNGRTVGCPRASACWKRACAIKVPHASVCGGRARCSTCRIWRDRRSAPQCRHRRSARPSCWRRCGSARDPCPPRLPVAPRPTICRSSSSFCRTRCRPTRTPIRNRPHRRHERYLVSHVRGHARLDPPGRAPPAVRHRLHRQPFPRARSQAVIACRRPAQPVARRRRAGAVWPARRAREAHAARHCRRPWHRRQYRSH